MENCHGKKRVLVGMSGGVDSSVAAYILKEQGFEVIGANLNFWDSGKSGAEDAALVCEKLGIPFHIFDVRDEFKKHVVEYFIDSYIKAETPNPCVVCNRHMKWATMLVKASELGADFIATGHYAKIERDASTGRYSLRNAISAVKDQTYVLYNLTQEQLSKTIMPLGDYNKDQVREIAKTLDLKVADKPESQDICFIPDGDYAEFIKKYAGIQPKEGNFIDTNGNILGSHKGIINYTIGQRKGLGIALGRRVFVSGINALTNEVSLADECELFSKEVFAKDINFVSINEINSGELKCKGKIRYNQKPADCVAEFKDGILKCIFDEPQRAATPGQALVLYDSERIFCGGTIIIDPLKRGRGDKT